MSNYLVHYGIPGQKWGNRRFQNEDGSLTPAGEQRYYTDTGAGNQPSVASPTQSVSNRPKARAKVVGSGSATASTKLKVGYGYGTGVGGNAKAQGYAMQAIANGKKNGENTTAYQFTPTPGIIKPKPAYDDIVDTLKPGQIYDGNTIVDAPTSQNYNVVPSPHLPMFTTQDDVNYAKAQIKEKISNTINKIGTATIDSLNKVGESIQKTSKMVISAIQKLLKKK